LNQGVKLAGIAARYGLDAQTETLIAELQREGLIDYQGGREAICLSPTGRLLSNEVFQRFIA